MLGWFRRPHTDRPLKPGRGWTTDVVGESAYQDKLAASYRRHGGDGHDLKVTARLAPEPTNPHDKNAVRVCVDGETVGYLPREAASLFRQTIDGPATCSAKIVGGHMLITGDSAMYGIKLNFRWPPEYA